MQCSHLCLLVDIGYSNMSSAMVRFSKEQDEILVECVAKHPPISSGDMVFLIKNVGFNVKSSLIRFKIKSN